MLAYAQYIMSVHACICSVHYECVYLPIYITEPSVLIHMRFIIITAGWHRLKGGEREGREGREERGRGGRREGGEGGEREGRRREGGEEEGGREGERGEREREERGRERRKRGKEGKREKS